MTVETTHLSDHAGDCVSWCPACAAIKKARKPQSSKERLYVKPDDLHSHSPDCRGSGCIEVVRTPETNDTRPCAEAGCFRPRMAYSVRCGIHTDADRRIEIERLAHLDRLASETSKAPTGGYTIEQMFSALEGCDRDTIARFTAALRRIAPGTAETRCECGHIKAFHSCEHRDCSCGEFRPALKASGKP